MKVAGLLGVVYDGDSLRIPVEGGEKALRVALRDPAIPREVRTWISQNLSPLVEVVRFFSSASGAWISIPLNGNWAFV